MKKRIATEMIEDYCRYLDDCSDYCNLYGKACPYFNLDKSSKWVFDSENAEENCGGFIPIDMID